MMLQTPVLIDAQLNFAFNGNPPGIKWKELSNKSARIIFPEGLNSRASRVADVIDYLNKNNRTSIGKPKGKISIILQNQLTEANGFVTTAPFRSEFYTTAPQRSFVGTNDWLDILSIHEYRHVMQLQFAKQGLTKIGYYLFGDIGWMGMGFLAIPFWFTEGDAVMQETLLSEGGRGRSGGFLAEYRAMHEAGIKYPYEKITNRSYKSILPNRYRMGYLLSQYGRNKYGDEFWKYVAKDAVRYKGILWSFSKSLKKRTGKNVHHFYESMLDSLYRSWDISDKQIEWRQSNESLVNKPISKNTISYYLNPKFKGNEILVLHSSGNRIPGFYTINRKGKDIKLFDLGYHDPYFNYNNKTMVWTQTESDARWSNKTFSVVYSYDFKTKKKKKLTSKTKYFSPDINRDGTKILVAESDELMKYSIKILDSKTGKVLQTIPNPKNIFLSSPKWLDKNSIIAISQFNQKNALVEIEIKTGEMSPIIDYTHNLILRPVVNGNYIYFGGDFTEVRNIFAVDINSKKIYQVTNSRVLASYPDISDDGEYLVYSERQINGIDIKEIELDKAKWRPITITEPKDRYNELDKLIEAEGGNILDNIPKQNYIIKDHSNLKNALKFHSWIPALQIVNKDIGLGVSLLSTNLLSTLGLYITPSINLNGEKKLSTRITWNKYFPKINLGYDIAKIKYFENSKLNGLYQSYYYTGVQIPLYFSRGAMNRGFTLNMDAGYQTYKIINEKNVYKPDNNFVVSNTLHFYNKRVTALKQLNPRFGQELDIQFKGKNKSISLNNDYSISLDAKLYFPGILRTHSLVFSGHYHRDNNKFFSIYSGNWIRGLTTTYSEINHVVRAEYSLPLFYPDVAIGPIAFIKRFRTKMFFDYGFGEIKSATKTISSFGIDLTADVGLFNLGSSFNMPFGIRISYLRGAKYDVNIQFLFANSSL